jgi:Lrp/AsnC family transcriptional regulator of ectoine degradation
MQTGPHTSALGQRAAPALSFVETGPPAETGNRAIGERMQAQPLRLDDRDLKILAILQREGRIAKSELARRVNLSATPCWARLQRLEEAGIITGYGARIAFNEFDPRTYAYVTVELDSHQASDFERFEAFVASVPEIFECFAVGGGIDYVMKVTAPDVAAYQAMLDGILGAGIGVKRYWTYFVTKDVKQTPPPVALRNSVAQ